jgi:Carboxypeptidase regulatory-like domain
MFFRVAVAVVALVALLGLAPARASGQTFTGSVVGRVLDPQHAVIAGAAVTLHSLDRSFERGTTTDPKGEYCFPLVPPGTFTLRAEADGFAVSTVTVEVVVATPVRADLILSIQAIQQEVDVFGQNGVAVQTENANLGRTINPQEMSELPSLTRSPYDFIALMPGASDPTISWAWVSP